jgi:Skp family chaperone for outer membrane proteins
MNVKKLLLSSALGLACLTGSVYGQAAEKTKAAAEKTVDVTKTAAKKTAEGTKKVAEKTVDVTKDAAKGTKKGLEKTAEVTKDVSKDVATGTKKVAEKTVEGTKKGVEKTAEVAKEAVGKKPEPKAASASEIATAKSKGLVWVNLDSKIYHRDGQFYGTTKNGKFMTEAEASKMGATPSKTTSAKK